jgi:hemerythrin-like domain-containing protein
MSYRRVICTTLSEDHRETVAALDDLEDLLARGRRGVPDLDEPGPARLLQRLAGLIDDDVHRHFGFEEEELFTRLAANGDAAIGEHLKEEHDAIRAVAVRVAELARGAAGRGMSEAQWEEFRGLSAELIERMLAHIQKEEMALLPLLEDVLEAEEDLALAASYGAAKA